MDHGDIYTLNKNNLLHRVNDKPVLVRSNGDIIWMVNGQIHRNGNKSAIIYATGVKKWFRNSIECFPNKETEEYKWECM